MIEGDLGSLETKNQTREAQGSGGSRGDCRTWLIEMRLSPHNQVGAYLAWVAAATLPGPERS